MYLIIYDKNTSFNDKPKIVKKYIKDTKTAAKLIEKYIDTLNCNKCQFIVADCFECADYYKCLMHNTEECNTKKCDNKNNCNKCGWFGQCERRFNNLKADIMQKLKSKKHITESKYNLN